MKELDLSRYQTATHDEGHLLRGEFEQLAPERFFLRGERELRGMEGVVRRDVIPNLEHFPGKWHPLGFMVWPLGVNHNGESLRLHVWPDEQEMNRKTTPGPHIHNHAWNLSSLVMKGEYTDMFFDVHDRGVVPEYERVSAGFLRKYQLNYTPGGVDGLSTNGDCVEVEPYEFREIEEGKFHHIVNGIYHVPTILPWETTATLVLDSPELGYNTTVLLDGPPVTRRDARHAVTPQEALLVKKLL